MGYITEKEATEYILDIIELFKEGNYDEVIAIIKEKNIDPQHSKNIISDYAALWLEEPHLIPFFKKIKEIGGNSLGHDSIIQNVAKLGKIDTLNYLIEEGALNSPPVKSRLVYIINGVIMHGQLESLKVLEKHIDLNKYRLLDESNPSVFNRALSYPNEEILDYLFESKTIQPYLFSNEAIEAVEFSNIYDGKKNMVINKVLDYFEIDKKKYQLPTGKYDTGDMGAIFKMIQYDVLERDLKVNPKSSKKSMKV